MANSKYILALFSTRIANFAYIGDRDTTRQFTCQ